jgi:DEAD/DEAH box helicase domain-containing protein
MCDRHDIGISIDTEKGAGVFPDLEAEAPDRLSVRIFVYDNYPGGIGFSEPLFRMQHELIQGTRRLIAECECENGCPGCVGPIGNTGPLAKTAALAILHRLLAEAVAA